MNNFLWEKLQPGDAIDIIAPASGFPYDLLEKIRAYVATWQLHAMISDTIFGDDLLCANSDEARFANFQAALFNPLTKAIWCAAGGYGSARLLPWLATLTPPPKNKVFIGLSDVTALHIFLQQKWGWPTLHGPAVRQAILRSASETSFRDLKSIVFGHTKRAVFENLMPLNAAAKRAASWSSRIIGGNLSLVQTSLGTPWQIDIRDKILLLEDTNERPYRIDRMLQHLAQTVALNDATAIIFGDFTHTQQADETPRTIDILERFAHTLSIPVLKIDGIGHGFQNYTLPLGTHVYLQVGNSFLLECDTGCKGEG